MRFYDLLAIDVRIYCKTIGDIANMKISCREFEVFKKNIIYLATAYADEFKNSRDTGGLMPISV